MRIVAVDDEKMGRLSLVTTIRENCPDARIDEYDDGIPAWEAIQMDSDIDLVITDIRMISMSGVELARKISEQYPKIQILFQTGESEHRLKEMGLQLERCLFKPLYGGEVKQKIENLRELPPLEIKDK